MSTMLNTARAVPVLMYHHVSPVAGAVTVSPVHFADQMAMLAREGYTTLGAQAFSAYLAGEPVPAKSVVLTFDDGYLDNWVHAHPVLARHGFTALGFLVSGWVSSGPARPNAAAEVTSTSAKSLPDLLGHAAAKAAIEAGESDRVVMRWSEIDAMRQAGTFEFHSHPHTQTPWDRVSPDKFPAALEASLAEEADTIDNDQKQIGKWMRENGMADHAKRFLGILQRQVDPDKLTIEIGVLRAARREIMLEENTQAKVLNRFALQIKAVEAGKDRHI